MKVKCDDEFDFIVIGSATGGVVATRLSESKYKVLLIEAGPADDTYSCRQSSKCNALPYGDLIAGTPLIPLKTRWFFRSVEDFKWNDAFSMDSYWNYNKTQLNFTFDLYRAKMLGGCLSHNGQEYTRGAGADFDYVAEKYNLPEWSFENILPYFHSFETFHGQNKSFRGQNGPIHIMDRPIQLWEYKLQAMCDTLIQSGYTYNNNQNGQYNQFGVGLGEMNTGRYQDNKFGLFNTTYYRSSVSSDYIRNIGLNTNYLTIWYNTTVQRIIFDNNMSKKAIGVQYHDEYGQITNVYCSKEIILSSGVYQSPQILMLSGIGPLEELNKFDILPVHIEENIGKHGQDHSYLFFEIQFNTLYFGNLTQHKRPTNHTIINMFNETEYFDKPFPGQLELFASSHKYNRSGYDYTDIRMEFVNGDAKSDTIQVILDPAVYSKNLTIKLQSNDSRIYPLVYQNLFDDSRDYDEMIEGIKILNNILQTNTSIFMHQVPINVNLTNVNELRDFIWKNANPSIHAVGTLSLGTTVDSKCLLKGVQNVRVVDTSIWPESTNSGTMSLAFMLGEKCSDIIIDYHKHGNYQSWLDSNKLYIIVVVSVGIIIVVLVLLGMYKLKTAHQQHNDEQLLPLVKKE
eukprot:215878_1